MKSDEALRKTSMWLRLFLKMDGRSQDQKINQRPPLPLAGQNSLPSHPTSEKKFILAEASGPNMGADKEIVNAAALAAGVETLSTGLTSFESSTRKMKGICEDFEGRLGKLEREMLPMKEISAKLSTSRRNIISAIGKVREEGGAALVRASVLLSEPMRFPTMLCWHRETDTRKLAVFCYSGTSPTGRAAAVDCRSSGSSAAAVVTPCGIHFQAAPPSALCQTGRPRSLCQMKRQQRSQPSLKAVQPRGRR